MHDSGVIDARTGYDVTTSAQSPVAQEGTQLETQIDRLAKSLHLLSDRLQPVLVQESEVPRSDKLVEELSAVPLARAIQEHRLRISDLADTVERLLATLGL